MQGRGKMEGGRVDGESVVWRLTTEMAGCAYTPESTS